MDFSVLPTFLTTILIFLAPPGPDMIYMLTVGLKAGYRHASDECLSAASREKLPETRHWRSYLPRRFGA